MEILYGNNEWMVNIENLLKEAAAGDPVEEARLWLKQSIYRVPAHIKNSSSSSYGPQLVSLGPFHHGSPDLAAMEEHKKRALLHLLRSTGRPFRGLVASVAEVVPELQEAYKDLDAKWIGDEGDEFLKVMLLDGCFLLEVMRTAAAAAVAGNEDDGCGKAAGEYAASNPVFSRHGELYVVPYVRRDMLMIENQLPLLVLQRLVAFLHGASAATDDAINNMVLDFVKLSHDAPALSGGGLALHPLDVCHRSLLHGPPRPPRAGPVDGFVPSATELHSAGVRFAASRTRSLHDIHFRRGVLSVPALAVDDTTAHKLLSLMAFEQLHAERRAANEVTAYVFLMDSVIKSAADAWLLSAGGALRNGLGSDEAVAEMFRRLASEAVLDRRSRLHDVHRAVNAHRGARWNEWRASLVQNHAGNPWAIISLAAAFVLLVLTVVQTVYTVLPYYDQKTQTAGAGGIGLLQEL